MLLQRHEQHLMPFLISTPTAASSACSLAFVFTPTPASNVCSLAFVSTPTVASNVYKRLH